MFCPKCGKEIPDQAKFCSKCGATISTMTNGPSSENPASPVEHSSAAQEQSATATAVKPEKKRKGKGKKILIAAVAVIAALILLPNLFSSPQDGADNSEPTQDISDEDEVNNGVANTGAEAELLAIIDEAVELNQKAADDYLAMDTPKDGSTEYYKDLSNQIVQLFDDFLGDLAVLEEKADSVGGLDDKMKNARDEFFHMLSECRLANIETYTFLEEYMEYLYIIERRPLEVDYADLSEYSGALSEWYQTAKEGYEAISPPACVVAEWEQYKAIIDTNDSIAQKLEQALRTTDWLRYRSTQNMTSRYLTVEGNLFNKFFDCVRSQNDHALWQQDFSIALAEEMHTYAEMSQEERSAYRFENVHTRTIQLAYDAVDTIYPSLYNTYDAFIIVKTGCISGTRDIIIEAEIPGFTQKYKETFRLSPSYQAIYIKPPALTGELDLAAAKSAQISVEVSDLDGTLIESKSFPVTLKSKYDFNWYSDEYGTSTQDNILCFLTPESSEIDKLKVLAAEEMKKISGGITSASFVGYQPLGNFSQYVNTYLHAAGLMSAINQMGIHYVNDIFSLSEPTGQHIKLPDDVLANRSGLCVETALVVASALQGAGMHAFLVFPRGHAMVAVEVWNSGDHAGEYFLIETTAIESSTFERFNADAVQLSKGELPETWDQSNSYSLHAPIEYLNNNTWKDYIQNYFEYVVDCNDSRLLGLTAFAN